MRKYRYENWPVEQETGGLRRETKPKLPNIIDQQQKPYNRTRKTFTWLNFQAWGWGEVRNGKQLGCFKSCSKKIENPKQS